MSVASVYGSTETGTVLVECERGCLHHNAASCRLELVPLLGSGELGRLLITPFAHPFPCYLRFDVGDLALPRDHRVPVRSLRRGDRADRGARPGSDDRE